MMKVDLGRARWALVSSVVCACGGAPKESEGPALLRWLRVDLGGPVNAPSIEGVRRVAMDPIFDRSCL